MNGKTLKVVEYNLTFGNTERLVNVFGCFKYLPNNNLYLIYTDIDTKYNIIYYGSAHLKNNSILSMNCKEEEQEIIKEYIFKVTSQDSLENFDNISLESVEGIEIISSQKLEVKPEIITSLVDLTIPKPAAPKEEVTTPAKPPKKSSKKFLIIILLLVLLVGGFYYSKTSSNIREVAIKHINCSKTYQHNTLDATVTVDSTFTFNNQDSLTSIKTVTLYQFNTATAYQDFINKGTIYKYMPDDPDIEGGFTQDDAANSFSIITTEKIDTDYNKPTAYEEVLSTYKSDNYSCSESVDLVMQAKE